MLLRREIMSLLSCCRPSLFRMDLRFPVELEMIRFTIKKVHVSIAVARKATIPPKRMLKKKMCLRKKDKQCGYPMSLRGVPHVTWGTTKKSRLSFPQKRESRTGSPITTFGDDKNEIATPFGLAMTFSNILFSPDTIHMPERSGQHFCDLSF